DRIELHAKVGRAMAGESPAQRRVRSGVGGRAGAEARSGALVAHADLRRVLIAVGVIGGEFAVVDVGGVGAVLKIDIHACQRLGIAVHAVAPEQIGPAAGVATAVVQLDAIALVGHDHV